MTEETTFFNKEEGLLRQITIKFEPTKWPELYLLLEKGLGSDDPVAYFGNLFFLVQLQSRYEGFKNVVWGIGEVGLAMERATYLILIPVTSIFPTTASTMKKYVQNTDTKPFPGAIKVDLGDQSFEILYEQNFTDSNLLEDDEDYFLNLSMVRTMQLDQTLSRTQVDAKLGMDDWNKILGKLKMRPDERIEEVYQGLARSTLTTLGRPKNEIAVNLLTKSLVPQKTKQPEKIYPFA